MFFRQLLNDETACASYLLGCKSRGELAVVDPHVDLVDAYLGLADAQGARIAAVLETHVRGVRYHRVPTRHQQRRQRVAQTTPQRRASERVKSRVRSYP